MKLLRIYIFVISVLGSQVISKAQYYNDDARLWLYVKLDKKITKRLKLQFILQNRINNNVTQLGQVNGNLELNYKINKHVRLTGGYVFGKDRNKTGYYDNDEQAYLGFILKKKLNRFSLSYRNLFQQQSKKTTSDNSYTKMVFYNRNKFTLKYELNKRVDVYVAEELNLPLYRFSEVPITRYRSFAGATYHLSKKSYLEGYFMFQYKSRLKSQSKRDFVYGITYSHSF